MTAVISVRGSWSATVAVLVIYGAIAPSFCAPPSDPMWGYFSGVAGQDGQIDAKELQFALTTYGIAGSNQPFSTDASQVLILMLDRDSSGLMGFSEFKEMVSALNQWKSTFSQYDTDRSGTVEPHELHSVIADFGYNISPNAMQIIVRRFAGTGGKMTFDNFIYCLTRLKMATALLIMHAIGVDVPLKQINSRAEILHELGKQVFIMMTSFKL